MNASLRFLVAALCVAASACSDSSDDLGIDAGDIEPVDDGGAAPDTSNGVLVDGATLVDALAATDAGAQADADASAPLDAAAIAKLILASKKLRSLPVTADQPDYILQIEAIANGTASVDCGIDIRILQLLLRLTQQYTTVGVSDINRKCSGILAGAGTQSSHWVDGGGKAVDIWGINGTPLNGSNKPTIDLINFMYPFMPAGTRIGQANCRTSAGNSVAVPKFTQFSDTCNHLHIDIVGAKNNPLTP